MKRILKTIGLLVGLVVGLAVVGIGKFLVDSGQFTELHPHFEGTCTSLALAKGSSEDIVIDHAAGFAYLSVLDRKSLMRNPELDGAIERIDLKADTWTVEPALESGPSDLHPHGMSLYVGPDGAKKLFVISHPHNKPHTIEIFDATEDGKWKHAATVRDTLFVKPNDLAAVGPNQFYVANDSGAKNGFDRATEMMLGRQLSTLAYYNGDKGMPAVVDMTGAGGIAVSADGSTVWVAETAAKRIQVYGRDAAGGSLTPVRVIPLAGGPDNIDVAPDGSLWVAAHANTLALAKHFAAGAPAPTQILHIEDPASAAPKVTEVYLNEGEQFSAGSVAAVYKNKMILGSITEKKLLVCTLPGAKTE